jgi:hypothetical protein
LLGGDVVVLVVVTAATAPLLIMRMPVASVRVSVGVLLLLLVVMMVVMMMISTAAATPAFFLFPFLPMIMAVLVYSIVPSLPLPLPLSPLLHPPGQPQLEPKRIHAIQIILEQTLLPCEPLPFIQVQGPRVGHLGLERDFLTANFHHAVHGTTD